MEKNKNCVDTITDAISKANASLCKEMQIRKESYECLLEYCESIDVFAPNSCPNLRYEAVIDKDKHDIRVSIICDDAFLDGQNKLRFKDLAERAKNYGMLNIEGNMLELFFVFPSIW